VDDLLAYLPGIALAYLTCLVGLMSPGPNILSVIGTSMRGGRRPGIAMALGVALGTFCWGGLTLAGLSALIAAYASAMRAVKTVGGLYLLWLAFKALRSAAAPARIRTTDLASERGRLAYFIRGLSIQMTNPKAALTWIAIISLGVQSDAPGWVGIAIVLGNGILSIAGHLGYAVAFSTQPMVAFYGRARRWIETLLGVFFALAGIKLLTARS
jgi:amino acid exporter